jgi:hypothetical protein
LDDTNGGGGAIAQYEPTGLRRVLGGQRQIAGTNRGHVGLLSSRGEIFKVDLVWTKLACIVNERMIEERPLRSGQWASTSVKSSTFKVECGRDPLFL